jgi:NADH-quinone oxidoreductase subunit L
MSQIGYMVLAAGLGPAGYPVAILHLITHGFFKAGLFLGAGSVMHAMGDEVDMRRFGGLARALPVTFATFGLGYLAIIGIPPLAGFYSKDAIIEVAFAAGGPRGMVLGGAALLGAGVTAFYMTRVMLMTFAGRQRWPAEVHPHEAPAVMLWPMIVLAAGSVFAGALLTVDGTLHHWLAPVVGETGSQTHTSTWTLTSVTLLVVVAGVLIAGRMYAAQSVPAQAPAGSSLTVAARRDLYGDAFNEAVFMRPGRRLSTAAAVGWERGIDGLVLGIAALVAGLSLTLRSLQTGFARSYALAVFVGAAAAIATIVGTRIW